MFSIRSCEAGCLFKRRSCSAIRWTFHLDGEIESKWPESHEHLYHRMVDGFVPVPLEHFHSGYLPICHVFVKHLCKYVYSFPICSLLIILSSGSIGFLLVMEWVGCNLLSNFSIIFSRSRVPVSLFYLIWHSELRSVSISPAMLKLLLWWPLWKGGIRNSFIWKG